MNQGFSMNKEQLKEKKRTKLTLILLDMEILSLQWLKIWKILPKDLKTLLKDTFILKKMKFYNKQKNGLNMHKKEKLHIQV
jgi:hypothetical protein